MDPDLGPADPAVAIPGSLRRRWGGLTLGGVAAWAGLWSLVGSRAGSAPAALPAAASGFILGYVLLLTYRHLRLNARPGEDDILATFGPGTDLTLMRGLLVSLLAGFLLLPDPGGWLAWLPALLYALVDLGDLLDGYLARKANMQTRLGERLDIEIDALGLLIAGGVAVAWGRVGWWFLAVALSRYLYLGMLTLRGRRGQALHALPESSMRRPLAGLMMVLVAILLWPVFLPAATTTAALAISLPFLSGFTRDALVVGGWISPTHPTYRRLRGRAKAWLAGPLPLGFRALAVGGWLAAVVASAPDRTVWHWLGTGMALMVGLGIAGRVAGLALALLAALWMSLDGTTPGGLLVIYGGVSLAVTGSGRWSLWRGEERLVDLRLGGQRSEA